MNIRNCIAVAACLLVFHIPSSAEGQSRESVVLDDAQVRDEIEDLKARLEALESRLRETPPVEERQETVDLSSQEFSAIQVGQDAHVLERPWYRNVHVSGFGAVGYLDSGDDGTRPHGGFQIKESSLFVEAEAWQDISLFAELQVNRLGFDGRPWFLTGEVNAHFRNVLKGWGDDLLGLKVGRVDIPFGEEYLWQDAIDNPLISNSVAYPYGVDEGVVAYGTLRGVGWVTAITDGSIGRSSEENGDKAFNLKVYGTPFDPLYLSGSFMRNGATGRSGFQFAGSFIRPVGNGYASTLGISPSAQVNANLYELNAKYSFGERAYLATSFGTASVDDRDSVYDRDFMWFSVEPHYRITPGVYAVLRYSEVGTYDSDAGYHFDGKTTAGGKQAFGYDINRLQRISVGIGWKPNPRVLLKGEIGNDWFDVVNGSPFTPQDDDRLLSGFELVLGF